MVRLLHKLFRRLRPTLVAVMVLAYGMAATDLVCAGHFSDLGQSSLAWGDDTDSGTPVGDGMSLSHHSHCNHFNGLSGSQTARFTDIVLPTRTPIGRDQFLSYLVSQRPDEPPRMI